VTVKWYDRDGVLLHQFTDTIDPNSARGYNTRFNANTPNPGALFAALGENWNGSVIVSSPSADIVAVANLQWTSDSPVDSAATAYASEPAGYEELFIPASFRRESGGWKQFTGLVVQNIGDSACTDFTVQWFDRDGVNKLEFTDTLALTGQSHGYNSRYGAQIPSGSDPADLGADYRGSVYISATGCELIAIHNTLWPLWTDSTTYNAFGQ
jgi:hypothetical protein